MRIEERVSPADVITGFPDSSDAVSDPLSSETDLASGSRIAGVSLEISERFAGYVDLRVGPIGRVVSSEREPAGAHEFHFWADDGQLSLDVGHIVVTFSEEAAIIGVVDEPRRFSDLRSFLDDYFDRQIQTALAEPTPTRRPEMLVFTVNVLATKHLRADVTSQRPAVGGAVYYATPKAIEDALGREEFDGAPIPALMHINGNPAYDERTGEILRDDNGDIVFQRSPVAIDEHYLVGPEAGHANWTGQSGLATKTSHALFLTGAVFQTLRNQPRPTTVAAVMFNVKNADLLWLDKPATPDPDDLELIAAYEAEKVRGLSEIDLAAYRDLGLNPKPFDKLRIFAPYKPGHEPSGYGENAVAHLEGYSPLALNTLRDARDQATNVVFPILWPLEKLLWAPHKVFEYADLDDKMMGLIYDIRARDIKTLAQLEAFFDRADAFFNAEENKGRTEYEGHHRFTLNKARNRFRGLTGKFGGLVTNGQVDYGTLPQVDAPFDDQELRVIDIARCNTNVQEQIVSSTINSIWKMAEAEKLGVNKLIVFVDELNKYAPGGGEGALRDTLVDIAARGRHLNVVLFGAQQFRSKVDDEILGNCGTSLYGRVGDEEIVNSAYRSLSESIKAELLGLPKGRLLIRHAHFRAPLFGSFPFPPTLPGTVGQRIFNKHGTQLGGGSGDSQSHAAVAASRPADGIWKLLDHAMGNKAPSKAEVRAACQDLSEAQVFEVLDALRTKLQERGNNRAFLPWAWTKTQIARYASIASQASYSRSSAPPAPTNGKSHGKTDYDNPPF